MLLPGLLPVVAGASEWTELAPNTPFQFYTPRDGLSQAEANHIAQDDYGFLWVTTRRGLTRYDGREFVAYTIANGLPVNHLTHVAPIGDDIWIGDARGNISRLRHGDIDIVHRASAEQRSAVTGIVRSDTYLYVATEDRGLYRIRVDGRSMNVEPLIDASTPVRELRIADGSLWLRVGERLMRQDLAAPWSPQLLRSDVATSYLAPDGTLWMADLAGRVGTLNGENFDVRHRIEAAGPLREIVAGHDGEIWVRSDAVLYGFAARERVDGSATVTRSQFDDLGDLIALFVDRENTLWIGADSRLARYLGDRFRHYATQSAGFDPTVWAISGDAEGNRYIGTHRGLVRWRNNRAQRLNALTGIPDGPVRDIVSAGNGRFFVGVRGQGVYQLNTADMTARLLPDTDGLEVLDLALDADNRLWIGSHDAGVSVIDLGNGERTRISPAGETSVYTLTVGPDGGIWYGADGVGIVHVDPNTGMQRTVYGAEHGIELASFDQVAWAGSGRLWIATEDGGLYRFDEGRAVNIGPQLPLRDQTAYIVHPMPDGTIVVGGEEGLYQIDPATLESYHYTVRDGFAALETNVHATYVDDDGWLWMGTVDGFTAMDTDRHIPEMQDVRPQIVRLALDGNRTLLTPGGEVPADNKAIATEFVAISLLHPYALEYSYRLGGLDDGWSPPTRNRQVDFLSLEPGAYTLEVRARFPNHAWSPETATFGFTILAPFWRTPWFIALALLALSIAVPLLIKFRMRQIERVNRRLRREVLERTRSIEKAKAHLEATNRRLSKEAEERRKADTARFEVEERFRRAFLASPIGKALITPERDVIDANPALKRMLWPDETGSDQKHCLVESVAPDERDTFELLLCKLESGAKDNLEAEMRLVDSRGAELNTVITLSAIRTDRYVYRYSVCQVQDVTEARRMNDQLAYQANYDELTGLLNRRAFESALTRAHREATGQSTASFLMFMDLDQFKIVNDTSGHAAGDELLKLISQLIRDQVRSNDLVGRLGGDEFALLLWECPEHVALRIAESIRGAIEDFQFNWDSETYRIGVSIGVVPLDPSLGDVSELQQLADAACYEAKDAGRNRVHITRTAADASRGHRGEAQWVQRLRDAMDNDRFALYGQLIKPVNPEADETERMEILLRMRDAVSRKLIPPGAFLPAAERFGLSIKLDQWVVENLIRTLFVHDAFGAGDRRYWINLSGNSVGDRRFAEFLVDAIKNSPLPAGTLNFEITETAVIRSVADAGKLMTKLRDLGCQFALDDFGSGLSSFGYLKKLPVDYLKIDGMFVRDILTDPTDRMFVRSIIDIAHTMGIKVTTEFIEDDDMLQAVASFGADYVQGYGIHRPEVLFPQFPIRAAQAAKIVDSPDEPIVAGANQ